MDHDPFGALVFDGVLPDHGLVPITLWIGVRRLDIDAFDAPFPFYGPECIVPASDAGNEYDYE
jgi:hypothetical protein